MTALQNPCYAWHFWDRASSTRLYTEKGKLQEKYRNLRCRCGFAHVEAGKTQRSHCFTASASHCLCPSSTSPLDHDPARTRACPYTASTCTTVMGSGWSRSHCVDKTVQSTSLGEVRPNVFCLRMMCLTAENWASACLSPPITLSFCCDEGSRFLTGGKPCGTRTGLWFGHGCSG